MRTPGDQLVTRLARPGDLLGAAHARIASWRGAFSGLVPQDFLDAMDPASIAASWTESIAAGRSRLYVAAVNDRIVGYAGVGPERDPSAPPKTGELYALFVHPSHWGVGAGRALANAACSDLREAGCVNVWLWVLEANARARRFYTTYGFVETGDRTHSSLNDLPEIRLAARL
ncbi:GNAT family N-acetyltransferase [Kribbella pratensis]|uniref:Ribosomal protein S18 acetylase RimI-like enzyme n=1 Tax=Kribbella pratensis TaxID=2512112 RepID=A0A4R8BZ05_9ACTN|nr:GNAT family N-acetyltransferase [Kribbella pratensis]TDW66413.1 ribosomal protein S18 acetylase RimI-like enzyme [Kribbella pratensis]